ncbi:hypothetical protein [Candidatus Odyssella thessalonicensis]|uniref:hypothetical protein n=1 Tax=Candidatus Odyssella thessalonicensis TaxID=84647 RepID=UPI000225B48F|nr:hypothetical protein [Candidatus Odyssella thessalonicensis]
MIKKITSDLLKNDGCLFVPQTSRFEGYLAKNYTSIKLYPYLKEDKDWAQELYSTLFDKQLPKKILSLPFTIF